MPKNIRFIAWAVFAALTGCLVVYVYLLKWIIAIGEKIAENLILLTDELKNPYDAPLKIVSVKKSIKKKVS